MECPVCKNKFNEKTGRRPKKFCSDGCKVKFWNAQKRVTENKRRIEGERTAAKTDFAKSHKLPLSEKEAQLSAKIGECAHEDIQKQIDKFTEQKAEIIGTSSLSSALRNSLDRKIAELKKQLI